MPPLLLLLVFRLKAGALLKRIRRHPTTPARESTAEVRETEIDEAEVEVEVRRGTGGEGMIVVIGEERDGVAAEARVEEDAVAAGVLEGGDEAAAEVRAGEGEVVIAGTDPTERLVQASVQAAERAEAIPDGNGTMMIKGCVPIGQAKVDRETTGETETVIRVQTGKEVQPTEAQGTEVDP